MIDPKHMRINIKDELDGTRSVEVGMLVRAKHTIPAKQVLEKTVNNTIDDFTKTHIRPLASTVINHIYGDLAREIGTLKTLAKLNATGRYVLEVQRTCTAIDKLLDLKI